MKAFCVLTGFLSPAHFIEPLASTLIWVALLLCTAHHHLLHEGSFTARRRTNGTLAFADPRGHEIHALADRAPPALAATG